MTRSAFLLTIFYLSTLYHPVKGGEVFADIWIQNGVVIDGLGGPAYKADILIKGDSIYLVGTLTESVVATDTVNAIGKVVTPGFIDPHAHGYPFQTPDFKNFTSMGVTTIALGQDGSSPNTLELTQLFENTDTLKLGPNIAFFIGHGTIRNLSGIKYKKSPSKVEIQKMSHLLADGMAAGAFGLSTGLEYTPGRYSNQFELDELAKVVGQYDGLIMSHMRTENDATMESDLAELFSQGDYANIHVSHMKVVYGKGPERAEEILQLLDQKRGQTSFNVSADVYPYFASYTTIGILFPEYALAPNHYGTERNNRRNDLLKYVREKVNRRNGPVATLFGTEPYTGNTLKQISDEMGIPFEEVLVDHIGPTGASAAYFSMDRDLQYRFLIDSMVMISSDGSPTMHHPRGYGSFAKVIEQFVVKDSLLTLEEAIRKMTALPAQIIGIKNRGILRSGFKADILIFNPDRVHANATYDSPHELATGFDYVIINGKIDKGYGRVLQKEK
ncbi:MAG: amidohydrolase family protein [Candidatus Marinimicrobia bacterium]|nr:amidohydrolase family protein [Candidatus Neomarinimicrobiota bacterium]MBL7010735.1 amidohydrolase family protein [Candidatus Neomarinimicrobiota bacterium]MBL7030833.1 amidohydrolase family protein [Candidatus Neomarinimicrobiota bacterium]